MQQRKINNYQPTITAKPLVEAPRGDKVEKETLENSKAVGNDTIPSDALIM